MSRNYDYEVIIKGLKGKEPEEAEKIIEDMEYDASLYQDNGVSFINGNTNLCGGESEGEAHERISKAIKEKFPKAKVKTRWTYLEELPYTEYGDDDAEVWK